MKIFLLGTEFFRVSGGIQQVNRNLMRALGNEWPGMKAELHVFSYKDRPGDFAKQAAERVTACDGNRWGLMAALARQAFAVQPAFAIITHMRLLPLAHVMRIFAPHTRIALLCHGAEVWGALPGGMERALRAVDFLVCPSEFTRSRMAKSHGLPAEKISVIAHGLEPHWTAPAARRRSRDGEIHLLTVCRMSRDDARYGSKGVDAILEALALRGNAEPAWKLTIVGEGDDRSRLEEKSRRLKLESSVRFLGQVGDVKLRELYASADAFVLPSDLEGFGIAFVEAMAHGVPVIARRAGAAPEVVRDEVDGILLGNLSADGLARAIQRVTSDWSRWEAMSHAARQRVQDHYLYSQFAARWRGWVTRAAPHEAYLARHTATFPSFAGRAHS